MINFKDANLFDIAQTVLLIGVGYYVIKAGKNIYSGIDSATSTAANAFVKVTNPLALPTMAVKSSYFGYNGKLIPQAKDIFVYGFPNMYQKIFVNDELKSEYEYLLDNGQRYTDEYFKG